MATFVPCPPLLIHDLGDPKRFHHMLRVLKPTSPMSLGTWAIMGYSGALTAEVARQWVLAHVPPKKRGALLRAGTATAEAIHDVPGIPLALTVAGYTGVLLSTSANPLWSKNKWLGPLFSASAIATGAAATSLALSMFGKRGGREESHAALEHIDTAAHIAEAVCLGGFLKEAGEKGNSLTKGSMKGHTAVMAGGLLASELLKLIPFRGTLRRITMMFSTILSLVSGFALRWAMVHAGHEAANDPRTNRLSSRRADV
jgi:formate-dependent nitrite reductase membrane component NrfD